MFRFNQNYLFKMLIVSVALHCFLSSFLPNFNLTALGQGDNQFENYEIRVIRPRYFKKMSRMELGAGMNLVMNDTFVYTLMLSGQAAYHFTERFALELGAGLGYSFNRKEKTILDDDFNIKTEVFRPLYYLESALLFTPAYGKVQLPEGNLVYFDTFMSLGGGMTGVSWQYSDMCQKPELVESGQAAPEDIRADQVIMYPTLSYGIGQKIFRNQKTSYRWDLKGRSVSYNSADSACTESIAATGGGGSLHHSIMLQVGLSRFF